ncbi:MAG: N-acetyl-gamma-glutamyl-phosphate reductase [Pseudobdellovibrionaceae bacterium]
MQYIFDNANLFNNYAHTMNKKEAVHLFKNKISVSIVGARGYSGLELSRLLLHHPAVELTYAFALREFSLSEELMEKKAERVVCLSDDQLMNHLTDVVFLATPPEVSLKLAPQILSRGKRVIDLSGAFRLKKNDYQKWYHFEHTEKEWLQKAHYGLVPFAKPSTPETLLISNPGCFATAVSMALIPLLKRDLIQAENIVIDAKSGTTGAGRKAAENLLFSEVDGNCLPYRIGHHQHYPEIQEAVELFTGKKIEPHFSTHLLPVKKGILASIYAQSKTTDLALIEAAFAEDYESNPLVTFGSNIAKLAKLSFVVGTPHTHLSYQLSGNKLYLFSTIDNLMKGAASQAVSNLNRLLDLPEQFGLGLKE